MELVIEIHVACAGALTRYSDGIDRTERQTLQHEGRRSIECHYANYDNAISII